ncbi:hypothetical protein [[Ruminococcus] torques]|uniref:hypothetical protein n=1 Tax=[Ruminococcus] torques TaxID=33039 RepID=UPI0025A4105A|nr:hypothetical protein [[Ruminococcus] torques]MDM8237143.1 hypothetical protein [[Ruminococcus] torques]
MNSEAYEVMKTEIQKGSYTELEAKNILTQIYAKKMLSNEEYNELMDSATELSANTEDGEWRNSFKALEERVKKNEEDIKLIRQKLSEEGTEVPEPDTGATGTEFDPITAYAGMLYMPNLYYKDPVDNQIYKARDTLPEEGQRLDLTPKDAVNVYFDFVRVS